MAVDFKLAPSLFGSASISTNVYDVGDVKATHQKRVRITIRVKVPEPIWFESPSYADKGKTGIASGSIKVNGTAVSNFNNGVPLSVTSPPSMIRPDGSYNINYKDVATYDYVVTLPGSGQSTSINVTCSGLKFELYGYNPSGKPATITWGEWSTTVSIPAVTWQWTISYNANGGSGAPGAQTKTYGQNLTLSSTRPSRTGYTFKGWATSSGGSVAYQPGGTYTSNGPVTLYAVWQLSTYTVSYNANGGSGAPGAQTKTYGQNLTLSSTRPTRANYTFKGWATSSGGAVSYQPGGTYTTNSSVTLYAVWELAYVPPVINSLSVSRCNSDGSANDTGTYMKTVFSWKVSTITSDVTATSAKVNLNGTDTVVEVSGTSGTSTKVVGIVNENTAYDVTVSITDSRGTTVSKSTTLPVVSFPIDVKADGTGVAIGTVADRSGLTVGYITKFNNFKYTHSNGGNGGVSGYFKVCTITIVSTYANAPIVFDVIQRGVLPYRIVLQFDNAAAAEIHGIAHFLYADDAGCSHGVYLHKESSTSWTLYIEKSEAWDDLTVIDYKNSVYGAGTINVTWHREQVNTLPTSNVTTATQAR